MFWVLVFLVGGGCFTWNMEASVAGKYDLASQHIDACDHFLEVLEKQVVWHALSICSLLASMGLPATE